jgi:hypothetical protein
MHDTGGADIPFILTAWDDERLERAMKYWADLSKGAWSEEEQRPRCTVMNSALFQTRSLIEPS